MVTEKSQIVNGFEIMRIHSLKLTFNYFQLKEDERREELLISSNLVMKVQPKFLEIFKLSKDVSIISGKSHFLTSDPKTAKYKLEMQLHKEQRRKQREDESIKERLKVCNIN